jgi:hypothetical protein
MSHRYHPGDTIDYNGIPMDVHYAAYVADPVDPTHPPGWFYAVRTHGMMRDLYLFLPAHEVEFAAQQKPERIVA